ncbi:MAG: glycosyltransferase family 4 protein [Campylobacterales bacterium]|nr:glycosyltransferase family 4 protein [Campylobacterales bacterium]
MSQTKLLCVLHRSPPAHGAAQVGDFIASSDTLQTKFICKFITIKSSDTIQDIGKINLKKIYLVLELYIKILWNLLVFRPHKLYFTASIKSVAFYRDVLLSTLWKCYKLFKPLDIYYHYHTKGVNNFISTANYKKSLTRFFLNDVNLILLSPMLEDDFNNVATYQHTYFLPNGVEDHHTQKSFTNYIQNKDFSSMNILYLSNMIKSKGYFEVLKLAKTFQNTKMHFHFAGGWQNENDEVEFFNYIQDNHLQDNITFHGFVNGTQKQKLFENSHVFLFPTRYPNEAFPLSVLEAFSYGLPILATDEASIPYIVNKDTGVLIKEFSELEEKLQYVITTLVNKKSSEICRKRYLENFSLKRFEENLVSLLKENR